MIRRATAIKFYCGLILMLYMAFPPHAFGIRDLTFENADDGSSSTQRSTLSSKLKEPGKLTPGTSDKSDLDKPSTIQESDKEVKEKENSKESLFKDATYENFIPQDDARIVDESYLEPRT
jgi:hypothetical protein